MLKPHRMEGLAPSNEEVATLIGMPAESLQGHVIVGVPADPDQVPVLVTSTPDPHQLIALLSGCIGAIADQLQGQLWLEVEPPQ